MRLSRFAIFIHRWLGVALCLVFLLWFPSGIGMMYWDYPNVRPADRLDRSPALDRARIHISPSQAIAALELTQPPVQLRLNSFDGRPVYRLRSGFFGEHVVYADTGEEQLDVTQDMIPRIASSWTGQPAGAAKVEQLEDTDQWLLDGSYRDLMPIWKYTWPNGEQVYVSEVTGEVVQYTTTASRLGAYVGAIPHWLYFPPLRKHGLAWTRLVIWLSGIGAASAILGILVALWRYSPSKRYRYAGVPTSIPYRGQKRWHMVLGLIFGVATATWAFSGMLSLDPFPMMRGGRAVVGKRDGVDGIPEALRGRVDLSALAAKDPREVLAELGNVPVKELEFTVAAGEPIYLATLSGGQTRIVPVNGEPRAGFDSQQIIDLVTKVAGPTNLAEIRVLDQYDMYYLDRHRARPLPVILARLRDADSTRYYIDPKTARVVGNYSSRSWVNRWLYHGLHSLDFPWLYNYRPAWDIVVVTFMLGGTALGVTSLVLAWQVLGRKLNGLLAVCLGSQPSVASSQTDG